MSLDHTMLLGVYRAVLGNTTLLKVTQGGHVSVPMRQQVQHNVNNITAYAKQMFVWNGNVYFPFGSMPANASGWACYNPELGEFETVNYKAVSARLIPLFDRVGYSTAAEQGWGFSPEDKRDHSADITLTVNDYVTVGEDVYILNNVNNCTNTWAYPFTGAPAVGIALPAVTLRRIAELGGEIYAVYVNNVGGTIDLYRLVAGTFVLQGAPSAHAGLGNYNNTVVASQVLFKFNNKLFFAVNATGNGVAKMRLFEIAVAGTSVERVAWLPNEWGVALEAGGGTARLFEIPDYISSSEQLFLVRCASAAANWQCYEFQEGAFIAVDSGAEALFPFSGAIYDPSCKAAQFKSMVDLPAFGYVNSEIEVSNLDGNAISDVDPRYRYSNAEPPPYAQCTEKGGVGSEGKVNLSSKPSGITTLAHLSDAFSAGSINEDLWQLYSSAIPFVSTAPRDWGSAYQDLVQEHRVQQIGGALRFGKVTEATAAYNGMGVKGKWSIDGAFQVDFTLKDPENIRAIVAAFANGATSVIGMLRLSPNEGFGFLVWKSTTGPQVKIRGFYMPLDGVFVYSADFDAADGDVVRIVRNGANVWALTHDPAGAANDITPGGGANYAQAVYAVMAGLPGSGATTWVEIGVPDGQEPGFSNLVVSGAGSLGLYYGGVKHSFAWDHVADLGAGIAGQAELFVDSEA